MHFAVYTFGLSTHNRLCDCDFALARCHWLDSAQLIVISSAPLQRPTARLDIHLC